MFDYTLTRKFKSIDGESLLDMSFPRQKEVIKGLLPTGLGIIAGRPKVGKSWLILNWCIRISKGQDVWNFKTTQGTVAYLCLEDTERRIQDRLMMLTEEPGSKVHFVTSCCALGEGLEEQIRTFVKEHPDTLLIVIDTLQKIRNGGADNSYANDYKEVGEIKKIADELQIAILLVHHTRKQGDKDPLQMLSGTNGIAGSADTIYVLNKSNRCQSNATLFCTGREIEERVLGLRFSKEDYAWELLGDSIENPEMMLPDEMVKLIEFMKQEKFFKGDNTEFAEKFSSYIGQEMTAKVLKRMMNRWSYELEDNGVHFNSFRSNGKRGLNIRYGSKSDDSDDKNSGGKNIVPVDPVVPVPICQPMSGGYSTYIEDIADVPNVG